MTHRLEDQVEFGAFTYHTLNRDTATHIFYYRLANTQSKSTARWVCLLMLGERSEIDEETVKLFGWDSAAVVLHLQQELDVAGLMDLTSAT